MDASRAVAVGDNGIILKTTNSYYRWIEKTSGVNTNLNSVFFINDDIGWIAGYGGIILKSTDGGETWDQLNSGTTMTLNSISFSNHLYGWVAGEGGVIKTTDGGVNWFQQDIINTTYYSIQLLDSYEGYVLGHDGRLFRTYDGGLNWDLIYTDQYDLYDISFSNIWQGWACGQFGRINHTLHIGEIWKGQYQNPPLKFNSIIAVDNQVSYVAGNNGVILRTLNGGVGIPVELISFTGFQENGSVHLNWETATELNNLMFEVQRKIEDNEWLTIGYKPGAGTTTELQNYKYTDDCYGLPGGSNLMYRLKQIDFNGDYKYSNEISIDQLALKEYALKQNYPNPFNSSTNIKYSIPTESDVTIEILNVLGKRITLLVNESKNAGIHEAEWNARDISSGIYFYRIQAMPIGRQESSFVDTKKMILLK